MFYINNRVKIVATILAKNEEDIIAKNIEHHINQGVSKFIITDNNSTDKTRSIIEKYSEVIEIIDEKEEDHNQSKWVTRMARIACKLNPDWIVHLDADEFWCGLSELRYTQEKYIGNTRVFIHPPVGCSFDFLKMRFYLDFENFKDLPGECKIVHRPDPNLVISHGNHGFENKVKVVYPHKIWRHHYPIRSYNNFVKKAVGGTKALKNRGAVCERWKKWNDLYEQGKLYDVYKKICDNWQDMIENLNKENFIEIINNWCEDNVINYFKEKKELPKIGEWPNL